MLGQLGEDERIRNFPFRSMTVRLLSGATKRGIKVAVDGEILWCQPPLTFRGRGSAVDAVGAPDRKMTLLQISDPHFGTEQPAVVEALLRLAQEIQPAAVIVSGDITQRARRAQFEAAREFVSRLSPPAVVAIPGNHDIPLFNVIARMFHPYAGFERAFGTRPGAEWQQR